MNAVHETTFCWGISQNNLQASNTSPWEPYKCRSTVPMYTLPMSPALLVVEKMACAGSILSKELYSESKGRLEVLDKKDAKRRRTAELKNNLESEGCQTEENC